MGEFLQQHAVSIIGLVITLGTVLIHIGVSQQKLNSVATRVQEIDMVGSQHGRLMEQKIGQQDKQLIELRAEQHSSSREQTEIRVLLSSVTTKLDALLKSVEALSQRS